ncbi:ABC transporter substrate-binding protein [Embleya scabrispora]|uniref:ABC transporter substrate-binding protein n=1 Tax=Embleya scabrispora TaxID=159449 RepID=UPI0004771FA1|nr:ABC transporter substrate-binding protein [Embleya scabrispora]MYS86730.1 ABC transporter substrate-binding protein [Streptomyces sp. SID5474]
MRTASRIVALTTTACLTAAACGGSGGGGGPGGAAGTVTIGLGSDPGTLNPFAAANSAAGVMNAFAYDSLVSIAADGQVVPGLAKSWTVHGVDKVEFSLREGVTCGDGTPLGVSDVANQFNYIADPKNQSPLLGLSVPRTTTATADDATRTVTVTTRDPAPMLLRMSAMVAIACPKGLKAPDTLARASDGTGPYILSDVVPGDHYTYVKRKGYTWGPAGAGNDQSPEKVIFKVVPSETTAANLLLSGQLNIAQVLGPDRQRLESAGLKQQSVNLLLGQLLFAETPGHPTADEHVRRALIHALDLGQIGTVATGGKGVPSKGLGLAEPKMCPADNITGNLPAHDRAQAAAELTAAGWTKSGDGWTKDGRTLEIRFTYLSGGEQILAAAELTVQQWKALGIKVTTSTFTGTTLASVVGGDAWDVSWPPFNAALPDQLVPFFSGPRPPQGMNFGGTDNPDHQRLVAAARVKSDAAGCADWNAAEVALFKRVDVVPFVDTPVTMFGKGVTFRLDRGAIVPTALRKN